LLVDQHLPSGIVLRIEVESPFGGEWQLGPDVGDEELVGEGVPGEADAEHSARHAVGSIGRDQRGGV